MTQLSLGIFVASWIGRSYVITGSGAVMITPEPVPVPAWTIYHQDSRRTMEGRNL